jgi:UDP-N-acetylglucosamine--N-acetylmuramyl-(pentapeptide) pyrophosphoryl-undecaprenol N-acetylglucosamine transferase
MDNHQYYNGSAFEEVGGGWVMTQDGFTPASLAARLEAFLTAPSTLTKAAENAKRLGFPDAAEKLASLVLEQAQGMGRAGQAGGINKNPIPQTAGFKPQTSEKAA